MGAQAIEPPTAKETMINTIIKTGWHIVELLFIAILICISLGIIIGSEGSGQFINSVLANSNNFLRSLPPGTFLGIFAILALYSLLRKRVQ
jgi:hypothetical protein